MGKSQLRGRTSAAQAPTLVGCPPRILDCGGHLGPEGAVLTPPESPEPCFLGLRARVHRGRDACIQLTSNFNTRPPGTPESDAQRPAALLLHLEDRDGHGPARPSALPE